MRSHSIFSAAGAVVAAGMMMMAAPMASGQFVALDIGSNPAGDAFFRPVGLYSAPGDYRRIFVVQKGGQIRSLDISQNPPVKQPSATPFLNLGALVQTPAPGAVFMMLIGQALTATRLLVNPQPALILT